MNWYNELNDKDKTCLLAFSTGYLERASESVPRTETELIEKEFAARLLQCMKEHAEKIFE